MKKHPGWVGIVGLILVVSAMIFYFTRIISGPFAKILMISGFLIVVLYAAKIFFQILLRD